MAKETYSYGKRVLFLCEQRPIFVPTETQRRTMYLYGTTDNVVRENEQGTTDYAARENESKGQPRPGV